MVPKNPFLSTIATAYQQVMNTLTKGLRKERMSEKRFPHPASVKYLVHFPSTPYGEKQMTDEQFNLYVNTRREYRRVCSDIEGIKSERCTLDNVWREGSLPPILKWWQKLLIALRLKKRPLTSISGERLQQIEDRLKYLDAVYERADSIRVGLASKLNDYRPTLMELRLVDFSDALERQQVQIEAQGRLIKALMK